MAGKARQQTQTQEEPEVKVDHLTKLENLTGSDSDVMATEEINIAFELIQEEHDLRKRIVDNREALRFLDRRGKLTELQGEWLDAFYPQKERGQRRSKEDLTKSRKVRRGILGVSDEEDEVENGNGEGNTNENGAGE